MHCWMLIAVHGADASATKGCVVHVAVPFIQKFIEPTEKIKQILPL